MLILNGPGKIAGTIEHTPKLRSLMMSATLSPDSLEDIAFVNLLRRRLQSIISSSLHVVWNLDMAMEW